MTTQDLFNTENLDTKPVSKKDERGDKTGYVYVLSNPSYGESYKIGFTSAKTPQERAKELYTTGVRYPFKVEFSIVCEFPYAKEQQLHAIFEENRDNGDREFFNVPLELIKSKALEVCLSQSLIDDIYEEFDPVLKHEVSELKEEISQLRHDKQTLEQTIAQNISEYEQERQEAKSTLNEFVSGNMTLQQRVRAAEKKVALIELEYCIATGKEKPPADIYQRDSCERYTERFLKPKQEPVTQASAVNKPKSHGLGSRLKRAFNIYDV